MADLLGIPRRGKAKENPDYQNLKMGIIPNDFDKYEFGKPYRYLQLIGKAPHKEKGVLTNEYSKLYDKSKYKFLLDCPYPISSKCCYVMKKSPAKHYAKETNRVPMTAQTASESKLRTSQWLKNGCNGFDMKAPISNPMAFWTEQDILLYIKIYGQDMVQRKVKDLEEKYGCPLEQIIDSKTGMPKFDRKKMTPICSVYGDIVEDADELDGQMCLFDYDPNAEIFDKGRPLLKTTGCNRTGCMFCGYGCHLEKEGQGRFERMKITHPKQYDYIMRPKEEGGLNYKEVIDWLNENGNLNIRY